MNNSLEQIKDWLLIRPEADLYTDMTAKLGINGITAEHVANLDDLSSLSEETTYGIIICYEESNKATSEVAKNPNDKGIFFAKQPHDNSCPTIALINILCNLDIEKGELLGPLVRHSTRKRPAALGHMLDHSKRIKALHNSYHIVDTESATSSSSSKIKKVVSYIYKNRSIWKLDSQHDHPIKKKDFDVNWLYAIRELLDKKKDKRFDIIALVKTPLSIMEEGLKISMDRLVEMKSVYHGRELLVPSNTDLRGPTLTPGGRDLFNEISVLEDSIRCMEDQIESRRMLYAMRLERFANLGGLTISETQTNAILHREKPTFWRNGMEQSRPNRRDCRGRPRKRVTSMKEGNSTTNKDQKGGEPETGPKQKTKKATRAPANKNKKNDTVSTKKRKTGGATSCTKEINNMKRKRDDDDDDDEAKNKDAERHRVVRERYNMRT
ncbi:cysteine proteinase [Backusella circina FSU 941]|nr:cysteine proteinase [Backusella circina FSU 941]